MVAIPSYQRPEGFYKNTYKRVLEPLGLAGRAILFLQTDEDEEAYRAKLVHTGVRIERAPKGFAEVSC